MKFRCLLCSIQCCEAEVLKRYYIAYHKVNEDDFCFKELFLPDNIEKNCVFFVARLLRVAESKKIRCFFTTMVNN